jgi:RNA polymerase sigma-70 factor, ECF subfamily
MDREFESGDARSRFEAVFLACHDPVLRYAVRRVAAASVQDVVAETFLVAWRRFDDLEGEPLPWLLGIARRVAANQRRSLVRREALIDRLRVQRGAGATAGEIVSMDPQLAAALARLGQRDREALLLVIWDELSQRDAARVLGCTTGALAVRLHRARRRLADALRESHHPGGCMVGRARSAQ